MPDDPAPADPTPPGLPPTQDVAPADPPPEPIIEDLHPTLTYRSDDPPPARGNSRIRFNSPEH